MGQNQGFTVEKIFINKINNHKFYEIENIFQKILNKIDSSINNNDFFTAVKKEGIGLNKKTDVVIEKNGKKFSNISLKKGDGNSVHEESLDTFIKFLHNNNVSQVDQDLVKKFIWGDGSIDGSAGHGINNIQNRMSASKINKKYPNICYDITKTFKKINSNLLQRVLCGSINPPDYLIHTSDKTFKINFVKKMSDVITYHLNIPITKNKINLGSMTFQSCNRCLQGQDLDQKSSKRRDKIQFKWNMDRIDEKDI